MINFASGRYADPISFPFGIYDYNPPIEPRRYATRPSHESDYRPNSHHPYTGVSDDGDEIGYGLDPNILAQAEGSAPDDYEYPAMGHWINEVRRRAARRRKKEDEESE